MKRTFLVFAGCFFALTSRSQAIAAWRDKVESLWPDKPMVIDGRATEWSEFPVLELGGLSFRAMNDSSTLYLLIRGANPDGRLLLSGNYRQNVTLWFLKPDHKSKAWGLNLDFLRAHAPQPEGEGGLRPAREIVSLSDMGIAPEMVFPQGLEVSTASFPSGFAFQADLSSERGRQPIYEMSVPLSMINGQGRSVAFDLVSSDVSAEVKAELQERRSDERVSGENKGGESRDEGAGGEGGSRGGGRGGGMGRRGRGMGGPGGGASARAVDLPKPLTLHLTVTLTKEPRR